MRAYKAYGYGGKQYLSGGQTKLDKNNDGKITSEDFKMLRKLKEMMEGGKMYENGGPVDREMSRPGRSVVSYRTPSKEMLDRTDGFFLPIPMEPEMGGVLIPRELENMEKAAIESGDPDAIAEYEAAMTKFKNSPEYKEQQEALDRRYQSAKRQYGEAKSEYDAKKEDYDKLREAMRVIMKSRLMD